MIEDDVYLNNNFWKELKHRPDSSIHIKKIYLTQRIINLIPGIHKPSAKPTPVVKRYLAKHEGAQPRKKINYRLMIGSLNLSKKYMCPEVQFSIHKYMRFSVNPILPHYQAIKKILKYPKGKAIQRIIIKPYPEKGIECYVNTEFTVEWNQGKGMDPGSVLSRNGYVFRYSKCPIMWERQLQTEIALSTTEVECIVLSQATRYVLPFVILTKKIEFLLQLQQETLKVMVSLLENPITVHGDNQGEITLAVDSQMRHPAKNIEIK